MGRELGIYRIDFLKDNTAIIRHNGYNRCGRTDFTQDIAQLFYAIQDKELEFLILKKKDTTDTESDHTPFQIEDVKTVHVKAEGDYWVEREFDMEYGTIDRRVVQGIVNEHMDKEGKNLQDAYEQLEDARIARQHSANLNIFEDFSTIIKGLNTYIDNFDKEAEDYIDQILKIEHDITYNNTIYNSYIKSDIENSFVLLTYSE